MKNTEVYVYMTMRRNKDNEENLAGSSVYKYVDYYDNTNEAIEYLKDRTHNKAGSWRIYRSVNRRDVIKTKLEMVKTMTDQLVAPLSASSHTPEKLWMSLLLQPRNKAQRRYLVDIDTNDEVRKNEVREVIKAWLQETRGVSWEIKENKTPNGFHLVCDQFDVRLLTPYSEFASVHKDGLFFVEKYEVEPQGKKKTIRVNPQTGLRVESYE